MYKEIIRPFFDATLNPESRHDLMLETLHWAEFSPFTLKLAEIILAYQHKRYSHEKLHIVLGGVELDNPLMVGAGWDKDGRAIRALYRLGFSSVEVGSILAFPQPGNPKPRLFMLGPGVALNRLGFNSQGREVALKNLKKYRGSGIPIGINIGKNSQISDEKAPEKYALVAKTLYEEAAFFVVDVSSPNTPGLRRLQEKELLSDIVQAINEEMKQKGKRKPLFVKIDPDLSNEAVDDVIEVVLDNRLTGIVATNTTANPDIKAKYGEKWRNEPGGVSGDDEDFRRMATQRINYIYKEAGDRLEIIGVGGINDTPTALEKILAGAKALQVVTGLREGFTLPGSINHGLVEFMNKQGVSSLQELVGQGHFGR